MSTSSLVHILTFISCNIYSGFILNSNEQIKNFYIEKSANQSIFNGSYMIEMNNNYFYESKKNFWSFDKEKKFLIKKDMWTVEEMS